MKYIAKTFFLVFVLTILTTCKKTSLRGDYFIFGISFGECSGNCVNYFLFKKDKLYPDDMETLPKKKLKFKNDELPADKVALAKNLKDQIPSFLKSTSSSRFGCPGCRDQGAYYLEFIESSETKKFIIDEDTSEIPKEIRPFVAEIEKVLRQL